MPPCEKQVYIKKKTKAEKQANIIKGTVKDQRNGKWMKNGKKGWREGKWQKTEICQLAGLNWRGFWVLAVVHRIWTQTVGCPWDLSILLLLTDFNQSLYLESKPTPQNVQILIFAFWQHILKMHEGSSSVPCMPQETRDLALVSKFIQSKFRVL